MFGAAWSKYFLKVGYDINQSVKDINLYMSCSKKQDVTNRCFRLQDLKETQKRA